VLDAAKTGWRIRPDTIKADGRDYGHPLGPKWKAKIKVNPKKEKEKVFDARMNSTFLTRENGSAFVKGDFVMDTLFDAAEKEKYRLKKAMKKIFEPLPAGLDPDLTAPWDSLVKWAKIGTPEIVQLKSKDLGAIKAHVQEIYSRSKETHGDNFTRLPIEVRQNKLRAISLAFISGPKLEDIPSIPDEATLARARASYAYKYDGELHAHDYGWTRFPFNVALRELCAIKAAAQGPYKTVQNSFYERFKLVQRHP